MQRHRLAMVLVLAAACGCALHHVPEPDAERYADAWETPRLDQQPVLLEFAVEGDVPYERLRADAVGALVNSGKFRPATTRDEPAYKIEVTFKATRKTSTFKGVLAALLLGLVPMDTGEVLYESFGVIREPNGRLVKRCYAQSRGTFEMWIGHVVWPPRLSADEADGAIQRDALKAVAVRLCRALMPRTKK